MPSTSVYLAVGFKKEFWLNVLLTLSGYEPGSIHEISADAIIVPLLGVVGAPFLVWGWGFDWTDFVMLLGMYALTSMGITVGFHRLVTRCRSLRKGPE